MKPNSFYKSKPTRRGGLVCPNEVFKILIGFIGVNIYTYAPADLSQGL
jgi:hypothetical protein